MAKSKFQKKKNKCWIWDGAVVSTYGIIRTLGKNIYVHRLSYRLFKGELRQQDCVLHSCDNPLCFNPAHLSVGTRTQNAAERDARGRTSRGEKHYRAKLSEVGVLEIKSLLKDGISRKLMARKFHVSEGLVKQIALGKTWKHI